MSVCVCVWVCVNLSYFYRARPLQGLLARYNNLSALFFNPGHRLSHNHHDARRKTLLGCALFFFQVAFPIPFPFPCLPLLSQGSSALSRIVLWCIEINIIRIWRKNYNSSAVREFLEYAELAFISPLFLPLSASLSISLSLSSIVYKVGFTLPLHFM